MIFREVLPRHDNMTDQVLAHYYGWDMGALPTPPPVAIAEEYIDALFELPVTTYCIEQNLSLVAFASLNRLNERDGRISNVYVTHGWRGKGVGARIVGAVEDKASKEGFHRLHLYAKPDLRGFYEKRLGFHVIEQVDDHLSFGKYLERDYSQVNL